MKNKTLEAEYRGLMLAWEVVKLRRKIEHADKIIEAAIKISRRDIQIQKRYPSMDGYR